MTENYALKIPQDLVPYIGFKKYDERTRIFESTGNFNEVSKRRNFLAVYNSVVVTPIILSGICVGILAGLENILN